MKASVIFTDAAIEDVVEAVSWYQGKSFNLGISFRDCLGETVERISLHPQIYPVIYRQARMALLHRFPYLIIYRIFNNDIFINAVIHGKRHSRHWKSRIT